MFQKARMTFRNYEHIILFPANYIKFIIIRDITFSIKVRKNYVLQYYTEKLQIIIKINLLKKIKCVKYTHNILLTHLCKSVNYSRYATF